MSKARDVASIQTQVDSVNTRMSSGVVTITPSAANTPTTGNISWGRTLSATPRVALGAATSVPGTQVTGVGFLSPTVNGCVVYLTRTNTTATEVQAIGVVA